jgi:hypothetical protein
MSDPWILVGVAAAVTVGLGLAVRARRPRDTESACELLPDGRDGQLAVRLAGMVGCTPLQALPAVRHELDLSPSQTDEVILKRAAYHYRTNLPERSPALYRDRVRG